MLVTCVPTHALVVRRRPADLGLSPDGAATPLAERAHTPLPASSRTLLRTRIFWSVAGAFVLARLAAGALGLPAAFVAGAAGLVQLLGRVLFAPLVGRCRFADLTALLFLVHAAGIASLAWWPSEVGALVFVLLYGQVNGWIALLVALGLAAAPWLAGVGHAVTGDYGLVLVALLLALVARAGLIRRGQHPL